MKQSIILSLSFYLCMTMYFLATTLHLEAFYSAQEQSQDRILLDMYTTLRVIKKIHRDVENQCEQFTQDDEYLQDEHPQQDFMIDIMIVLVGTYEKIVSATVNYYIMMHTPMQQDLQNNVAMIIAEDVVKIFNILGRRLIVFLIDHKMTWQKKIWYCMSIASVIIMIKIGIDQIPKIVKIDKPESSSPYIFPRENDNLYKISEPESGYLKDQFNYWK